VGSNIDEDRARAQLAEQHVDDVRLVHAAADVGEEASVTQEAAELDARVMSAKHGRARANEYRVHTVANRVQNRFGVNGSQRARSGAQHRKRRPLDSFRHPRILDTPQIRQFRTTEAEWLMLAQRVVIRSAQFKKGR
jgi:hypothetical protein